MLLIHYHIKVLAQCTHVQKFEHSHVGCTRDVAMRTRIAHFKTWSQ